MRAVWNTDPGPDPALRQVFAADQPSTLAVAVVDGVDVVVTVTETHEDFDCHLGDLHHERCPVAGLRVWDRSTGALIRAVSDVFENGFVGQALLVTVVLDGRALAVVGDAGRPLAVVDLQTGARVGVSAENFGGGDVRDLAVAELADGPAVVTVGWDGFLRVTELRSGRTTVVEVGERLTAVTVVHVAGRALAATGRDAVTLWDLIEGGQAGTFPLADGQIPAAIVSWPDGDQSIAVLFVDGTIAVCDVGTGSHRLLGAPRIPTAWSIAAVTAADGRLLLGIGDRETVRLWDIGADEPFGPPLAGPLSYARMLSDGPGVLLACSPVDDAISTWRLDVERPPAGSGLQTWIRRLAVTTGAASGTEIVAGSHDGVLSRWDLSGGARRPDLGVLPGRVNDIAVIRHGTRRYVLAVGGESAGIKDGWLHRWADGDPLAPIRLNHHGHGQTDIALTFSLDGEPAVLTAGCDSRIQLTQVRTGLDLGTIDAHPPRGIAVGLLAGRPVAAICGLFGPFTLWDLTTRAPITSPASANIEIGETPRGWIDAGPTLITVRQARVRLHNLRSGAVTDLQPDTDEPVTAVALTDDTAHPTVLAIARTDGTVSVIDATTGQNIDRLKLPYPAQELTWATGNQLILASRRELYCYEVSDL